MTSQLLLNLQGLIKFIELPSNNPYTNKQQSIYLGLYPVSSRMDYWSQSNVSSLVGRISPISLANATRLAQLISEEIKAPIIVIKEFKFGSLDNPDFFETDPKTNEKMLKSGIPEEDVFAAPELQLFCIEHFAPVVTFLHKNRVLSTYERNFLVPYIWDIEKLIHYRQALNTTVTSAQKDALRMAAQPYVQAIIDICVNKQTCQDLFGASTWSSIQEPIEPQAIARAVLYSVCQWGPKDVFTEHFPGLQEEMSSGKELYKIYQGDAALESKLLMSEDGIPQLNIQRLILADLFEEILFEKFGPELTCELPNDIGPLLAQSLRKRLFAEGYFLDMVQYDFSYEPEVIRINSFASTIDAWKGDWGIQLKTCFQPKHFWYSLEEGKSINGAEAKERFAQILSQVETQLKEQQQEKKE